MTEVVRHALFKFRSWCNSNVKLFQFLASSCRKKFWRGELQTFKVNLFMHCSNLFFDQQEAKANKGSSKRGRLKGDKIRMHFLQFMRVRVQSECL